MNLGGEAFSTHDIKNTITFLALKCHKTDDNDSTRIQQIIPPTIPPKPILAPQAVQATKVTKDLPFSPVNPAEFIPAHQAISDDSDSLKEMEHLKQVNKAVVQKRVESDKLLGEFLNVGVRLLENRARMPLKLNTDLQEVTKQAAKWLKVSPPSQKTIFQLKSRKRRIRNSERRKQMAKYVGKGPKQVKLFGNQKNQLTDKRNDNGFRRRNLIQHRAETRLEESFEEMSTPRAEVNADGKKLAAEDDFLLESVSNGPNM